MKKIKLIFKLSAAIIALSLTACGTTDDARNAVASTSEQRNKSSFSTSESTARTRAYTYPTTAPKSDSKSSKRRSESHRSTYEDTNPNGYDMRNYTDGGDLYDDYEDDFEDEEEAEDYYDDYGE